MIWDSLFFAFLGECVEEDVNDRLAITATANEGTAEEVVENRRGNTSLNHRRVVPLVFVRICYFQGWHKGMQCSLVYLFSSVSVGEGLAFWRFHQSIDARMPVIIDAVMQPMAIGMA